MYSTMDDATDTVDLGDREYSDESVPAFGGTMQPPPFFDELLSNHISALADLGVDVDDGIMQTDDETDTTTLLSHYHEATAELDSGDEDSRDYEHSNNTVPIVLPRQRYAGTCNVETIKDGKLLTYID